MTKTVIRINPPNSNVIPKPDVSHAQVDTPAAQLPRPPKPDSGANTNTPPKSTQEILNNKQPPAQASGSDLPSSSNRPLSEYVTTPPDKMPSDYDDNGLRTYRGRKYAELQGGGVALVSVGSDGTVRAKLSSELNPSGPILHRNPDNNKWSERSPDSDNRAKAAGSRPSGSKDGSVTYYPASQKQLDSYLDAAKQIDEMQVPLMHRTNDPNSRLFVAAFDGTGNNGDAEVQGRSNVAEIAEQYKYAEKDDRNISVSYIKGPGTQNNPISKVVDQATGRTYPANLEKMYADLQTKAQEWFNKNPNIRISVANVGFSRGAEQAAGFARLVHERGILVKDRNGSDVNLIERKQVVQAVALFDPVGTGVPHMHDRSQPDSVVSGLQIRAKDEKRDQFKDTAIITHTEPNSSFRMVEVSGSHSDIGGGYTMNGLSTRSGDLMRRYLNGLTDATLNMQHKPNTNEIDVIHRSEEGLPSPIYTTKEYDKNGARGTVSNGISPFTGPKRPASSIEPWSGLEYKLEYLPIGVQLNERSTNLLQSSQDAFKKLDEHRAQRLGQEADHPDEASSRLEAFATLVARRSGMEKIASVELSGPVGNSEITILDSRGERVKFGVKDAWADSKDTTLRRISEFDSEESQVTLN